MENLVEITHLTKFYGKARGIEDVSFEVRDGELFGFIGPNGAGKSTTIRTLLGLIHPTSGSATIFGRDCIREGASIRREIGYLPSEVAYYENMKVIDLLRYSASFYGAVDMTRIRQLADALELELGRRIDDLSYGNRKKVGIVQGLVHHPRLIILDEPTGGLDPLMQQTFYRLIREENLQGATVMMSSHVLSEVQKLCSRVAIIKDGRILRIEDIETMRRTAYKKVRILFAEGIPEEAAWAGASEFVRDGDELSFLFAGDINAVIRSAASFRLLNITIEEPDLEEIFMRYYGREE